MRSFLCLSLLATLPATVVAGSDPADPPAPYRAAALERALDTVSAARIQADVDFVACDEMGGRDTPSNGQRITARFIQNRLRRLGFQPGYKDGYLYPYELQHSAVNPEGTMAVARSGDQTLALQFGRDYYFLERRVQSQTVEGPVVFGGTGEYGAADVQGKWVLFREGENSYFQVARQVASDGGLGVLVLPSAEADATEMAERMKGAVERLLKGSVSWPSTGDDSRPGRRGGPSSLMVRLTREAGERLLALGSKEPKVGDPIGVIYRDTRDAGGPESRIEVENVCGLWPGSHPTLKHDVIILSGHYDHVGVAASGDVFNGADDNGSGTVGLLALAEALVAYGPLERSVLILWVSGEEKGLLGSRAWCDNPWLPEGHRPVANINLDMIGRNAPDKLDITPTKDGRFKDQYNAIVQAAEALSAQEGFPELGNADAYYNRSDHANFARLGMPVAFLFSDVHEDYHKVTDTPDKIDTDKVRRVVRLVVRMLDQLQRPEAKF